MLLVERVDRSSRLLLGAVSDEATAYARDDWNRAAFTVGTVATSGSLSLGAREVGGAPLNRPVIRSCTIEISSTYHTVETLKAWRARTLRPSLHARSHLAILGEDWRKLVRGDMQGDLRTAKGGNFVRSARWQRTQPRHALTSTCASDVAALGASRSLMLARCSIGGAVAVHALCAEGCAPTSPATTCPTKSFADAGGSTSTPTHPVELFCYCADLPLTNLSPPVTSL